MITQGEWINGYGDGITGPTTPSTAGPTVCEAVAYEDWKRGGCKGDNPCNQHTIVSCNMQTIAIVPTIEPEGEDNAALIAAAPQLLEACEQAAEWFNNHTGRGVAKQYDILTAAIEAVSVAK